MNFWDDTKTDRLKDLAAKGLSASQIGKKIGCTRSAVLGKLNRMKIHCRPLPDNDGRRGRPPKPRLCSVQPVQRKRSVVTGTFLHGGEPTQPMPQQRASDVARVAIFDLEPHHCRFPVGEPTEGFCGHAKVEGLPYCEEHVARCYAETTFRQRINANTVFATPFHAEALKNVAEFLKEPA